MGFLSTRRSLLKTTEPEKMPDYLSLSPILLFLIKILNLLSNQWIALDILFLNTGNLLYIARTLANIG